MLRLAIGPTGGPVMLFQTPDPPMVYLDHWALRRFSEDLELGARLANALEARGGTLALSWLNLGEYATVSVPEQRRAAEQLVDAILPAVFCIQVDPAIVEQGERAENPRPHADSELAGLFLSSRGGGVNPFTAAGLFETYNAQLAATRDRLAGIVQGRLEFLRQTHTDDPDFRRAVEHSAHPQAIAATTRTRVIVRELAATFFPDLRRPITLNDGLDFLHAAIPVAYCDVVLLDGGTVDMVERARRHLDGTRITMATVFSGRGDGVERFLAHLEVDHAPPTSSSCA
jgi:hypothetical protein